MKYAIETSDLTKKYGDFLAVDALNMKVRDKTIFGFLGPNGAGKTTTIKMLTCLILPTSGTATVAGYDILKNPDEVRQKIGMVPQLVSLYGDLTVKENIHLCADFYGLPSDLKEDRADELMEMVDIKYAEDKLVKQLSGGMKQKASVVASLIHQPDILFLDEPTIGLDPTTKRVLWDLVEELNSNGHTIILCSHDMYEVELLCDDVGIISQGKLAAFDTPQGLKDTMIKEIKEEKSPITSNVSEAIEKILEETNKEDREAVEYIKGNMRSYDPNLKELSFMISNNDQKMLDHLNNLPIVYNVAEHTSGRITLDIEDSDEAVTKVIADIIEHGGNITSIATKDPSLEDVFMRVTSKKKQEEGVIDGGD
ncbi:ATP-binding cassette domain-containing protein [Methanobacterium sp. ACI-7]|uniref:ATP-binding cassette domain-containing protein n=1 Tax=unclassified Methanobacterium TaxID=2627676 RepID=UPI0039C1C5EF